MKEYGFTLKKARSRQHLTQTISDTDNTDDIVLLANTPSQAESQLYSLEKAAGGIDLHVNAGKTDYMHFDPKGDIFTLNVGFRKLLDKFGYLESNVSTTKNDINKRLVNTWTIINWLSIIWKSNQSNKIKHNFFPSSGHVNSIMWMHHIDTD